MNIKDELLESITIATGNLNLEDFDGYVKDLRETIANDIDTINTLTEELKEVVQHELDRLRPKMGDIYLKDGEQYLLCRVDNNKYSLIIIDGWSRGNRWCNPVEDINDVFDGRDFTLLSRAER